MNKSYLIYALLVALGAGASGGTYVVMQKQIDALHASILTVEQQRSAENAAGQEILAEVNGEKTGLEKLVADLTKDRDDLADALHDEKEKVEDLEDRIGDALKTVGTLDKLSKIDTELLQKYSKVFFLNEHYRPAKMTPIDKDYVYSESEEEYIQAQAAPFFKRMVTDAKDDSIELYVVSAFRSFEEQKSLKSAYTVTYGSGANTFSADQGYSEHQLGTTIDFTTKSLNGGLTGFDTTSAFEWLVDNAYRYGFVLSYPKGNAYYVYEPWHWRFVGEKLAEDLRDDKKYFYDLDQRDIDKYLISLFD